MTARGLILDLADAAATAALGARLASACRTGDIVALYGDLGAGKTALARGLIRRLAGDDVEVPSPTFTLVQTYPASGLQIWHFDLYRLKDPREVWELGWDAAMNDLMVIEWPEQAGSALPDRRLDLRLTISGEGRTARLVDHHDWSTRFDGAWHDSPGS